MNDRKSIKMVNLKKLVHRITAGIIIILFFSILLLKD